MKKNNHYNNEENQGMRIYRDLSDMEESPTFMDMDEWDERDGAGFRDHRSIDGQCEVDRDATQKQIIEAKEEKWTLTPRKKVLVEMEFMLTNYRGERKMVTRMIEQ